jgi:glycosyltransferase involved in cell wall biosynthesis
VVFVARHVLEAACEKFDWPADDPRLSVVPNAIDTKAMRLPKLPGAEFTLGMIGCVPWIKRLDRALELLEHLRAHDDRYRLVVKGRDPWHYPWMATREHEKIAYERAFHRIERSPNLGQAVIFEPFGEDVPEFLQQVGWILSTSEIEGHSVALAEGIASGAVPVVIDRPGASDQYETHWVHRDPGAAAQAILNCRTGGEIGAEGEAAIRFAERWSWSRIGPEWDRLLRLSA